MPENDEPEENKQVVLKAGVWEDINEIKYELMGKDRRPYTISDAVYECILVYNKVKAGELVPATKGKKK